MENQANNRKQTLIKTLLNLEKMFWIENLRIKHITKCGCWSER